MLNNKPLPPILFFIFGGSGDLNYRKLTPALYNLFLDGSMPEKFNITGIARTEYAGDSYKEHLLEGIENFSRRKSEVDKWTAFSEHINYLRIDLADEKSYAQIADFTKQKEQEFGEHPTIIFYMAVAPQLVPGYCKKFKHLIFLQRYKMYPDCCRKTFWA